MGCRQSAADGLFSQFLALGKLLLFQEYCRCPRHGLVSHARSGLVDPGRGKGLHVCIWVSPPGNSLTQRMSTPVAVKCCPTYAQPSLVALRLAVFEVTVAQR